MAPLKKKIRPRIFDIRDFTSILCHAQYRRDFRETQARQNFHRNPAASLEPASSVCTCERKPTTRTSCAPAATFNGRDRLAPRLNPR